MPFKDHFSGHAAIYRDARPHYPPELYAWLAAQAPARELAWDAGCGNGQATVALAAHFARVVGTDPSAAQVANAEAHARVEYRVEPAEQSSFADGSVDLVNVAQALHWFDHARFYAEVQRVLKPGGVVAATAYADCSVDAAVDAVKDRLYIDMLGAYWPPERPLVDSGYRTLAFPFEEIAAPPFAMRVEWTLAQFLAYLRSWSATQRYLKARGEDPVAVVAPDLAAAWGDADTPREVRWQFHVRVGRRR
ncbi:MAG: class I SAM-dependent methyltransferase [Mizugakiibacter sp.]|uniref:class I SAM-dependent methyltransferase n=1 Tax=Mizugakiibacter sp. TaxID=1972610 RepID=UPI00320F0573